jgi:MFS family permease
VLVLIVPFLPVLTSEYGAHNDYSRFNYDGFCCFPETRFLFEIGRPLGAILLNLQFAFFDSIADFSVGRAFSLAMLAGVFLLTWKRLSVEAPSAAPWVAMLLCLLPASLVYVFWLANLVPGTLTVLLATVSALLVEKSYSAELGKRRLRWSGYGILGVCFLIYPPNAFHFLTFTAWRSVTAIDRDEAWHRGRSEVLALSIASVAYFVFAKVNSLLFAAFGVVPGGAYDISVGAPWERLGTLSDFAWEVTALWFRWPLSPAALVLLPVALLIATWAVRIRTDVARWRTLAVVIGSLALAAAPILLSAGGFATTRNMYAASAIVAASSLGVFWGWASRRQGQLVLGGLSIFAAVAASSTLMASTINAQLERDFVRSELVQAEAGATIMVRQSDRGSTIVPGVYGDFALMATNVAYIDGLPRGVLKDLGREHLSARILFAASGNVSHDVAENAFEICMATAGFGGYRQTDACGDRVSRTSDPSHFWFVAEEHSGWGVAQAFDGSVGPGSFWFIDGSDPVHVTLDYRRAITINGFEVAVGADGFPESVRLLVSDDGVSFKPLLSSGDLVWQQGEVKSFQVSSTEHRYARVEIDPPPGGARVFEIRVSEQRD